MKKNDFSKYNWPLPKRNADAYERPLFTPAQWYSSFTLNFRTNLFSLYWALNSSLTEIFPAGASNQIYIFFYFIYISIMTDSMDNGLFNVLIYLYPHNSPRDHIIPLQLTSNINNQLTLDICNKSGPNPCKCAIINL